MAISLAKARVHSVQASSIIVGARLKSLTTYGKVRVAFAFYRIRSGGFVIALCTRNQQDLSSHYSQLSLLER